jgi:hypothetical protein
MLYEMSNVEVPICFKEMKEGEDQGHQSLTHTSMLWFKLTKLGIRRPEKDLPDCLPSNHGC